MKNAALVTLGLVAGFITFATAFTLDVDRDGEVIYEDENVCVKGGQNKSKGWCFAKVIDKNFVK